MIKEFKFMGPILHQLYSYSLYRLPQLFENHKSNKTWNFYFFLICVCHSVLKIIQNCGFFHNSTSCDFTKLNFRQSTSFLEILSVNEEDTFIEEFKYLLSEFNYTANFCELTDRFTLHAIIGSIRVGNQIPLNIQIFNADLKIPEDVSFNACLRHIQSLPRSNLLEDFKLHHYVAHERVLTVVNFWKLTRQLFVCSNGNNSQSIETIIDDIATISNIIQQVGHFTHSLKDLMTVFLNQEIQWYQKLVKTIMDSLNNLKEMTVCQFPMSSTMKNILTALLNNEVPYLWNTVSYPHSASLRMYIVNLTQKLIFLNKWIQNGQPNIMWLPGIFNVSGFFTTVMYNFSKFHELPLREVCLLGKVIHSDLDSTIMSEWAPYYSGLILVGGYWDREKRTVVEPTSKNYYDCLPIMWIEPKLQSPSNDQDCGYPCPLYYTNISATSMEFPFPNYITHIKLPSVPSNSKLAQLGVKLIILAT